MAVSRVEHVDHNFRERISAMESGFTAGSFEPEDPVFPGAPATLTQAISLLECQIHSRWIDFVARELKSEGKSFYTIGSSGHEGNAMVGQIARHTDPAFLHYRSGGFFFARARQLEGQTPVFDTALSLTASSQDPISGGRHKVWGSVPLNIPPQTSTIASHVPKAVGAAFLFERRKRLGIAAQWPEDSIFICSFGDASINHSTAVGGVNAAAWGAFQNLPFPLLLVCEDNGLGISVHTPENWVEANYRRRAGLKYFQANGLDFVEGYPVIQRAVDYCRTRRMPAFLHLKTVRLLGHAGSDVEQNYHDRAQIEAAEAKDPVLKTAQRLVEAGALSPGEVLAMYDRIARQTRAAGQEASRRPKHVTPSTIMAPLRADYAAVNLNPRPVDESRRRQFWRERLPELEKPRHMAAYINWALQDLCLQYPEMTIFGEDVAKKGGVYHVTAQLLEKFGKARVFNTLLDEQTILGIAQGAAFAGMFPVAEIQYLAYLHNAIDQIRGEAASLKFFSDDQYRNPMIVRIASFAYQKGFGGHFHNDNALAALREIPGVIVATASTGRDAARLLRASVALAKETGAVVLFLEPIALYMTRDLLDKNDGLWTAPYPEPGDAMPFGETALSGDVDAENLIITYANGHYLSQQARADLARDGVPTAILELRFLKPLNREAILNAARGRRQVVLVDECRRTGGISEEIAALLVEGLQPETPRIVRVCGEDAFIPLGQAWECVLPSRQSIYEAVKEGADHG